MYREEFSASALPLATSAIRPSAAGALSSLYQPAKEKLVVKARPVWLA